MLINNINDIGMIISMKHWSEIVSTSFGYQLFMDHLELEFSIENLLFITEYIQIKYVLSKKFDQLNQLLSSNKNSNNYKKDIGFNIKFGFVNDDSIFESYESNKNTTESGYPLSLIAKQLYNDLDIINAFKTLYKKYIDYYDASFMINISSQSRNNLMTMLDDKYYKNILKNNVDTLHDNNDNKNNNNNKNNNDIKLSQIKGKKRLKKTLTLTVASQSVNDYKNETSLIDQEYFKNGQSIEWLLIHLLSQMDIAALEISNLMKHTFVRFKAKPC